MKVIRKVLPGSAIHLLGLAAPEVGFQMEDVVPDPELPSFPWTLGGADRAATE